MKQNKRRADTALLLVLCLSALAITALLFLIQRKSNTPASLSAGYPAPATLVGNSIDTTPALPVESTAWWKQTDVAVMATRSAEATPITEFVRVPLDPTPIAFLKRPAGDGMLVVQAGPFWYDHLNPTSAWVTKTADKYITVFVGLYLTESLSEVQIVVESASLKDYSLLDSGKIIRAPIQDTSLAIVDASGHNLILHSASGETVWFDAFAQTFSTPGIRDTTAERSLGAGKVVENSTIDFAIPGARVFDTWSVPIETMTLEVFAGEVKEVNAPTLSYGRGTAFIRETDSANGAKILPIAVVAPDSFGALRVFTMVEDKLVLVDARGLAFVLDPKSRVFLPMDSVKLPRGPFFDGLKTH